MTDWQVTNQTDDDVWGREIISAVLSSSPLPLPPREQRIGASTVRWWEGLPGDAVIMAEGGSVDDRTLAEHVVRDSLRAHGYHRVSFDVEGAWPKPQMGDPIVVPTREGGNLVLRGEIGQRRGDPTGGQLEEHGISFGPPTKGHMRIVGPNPRSITFDYMQAHRHMIGKSASPYVSTYGYYGESPREPIEHGGAIWAGPPEPQLHHTVNPDNTTTLKFTQLPTFDPRGEAPYVTKGEEPIGTVDSDEYRRALEQLHYQTGTEGFLGGYGKQSSMTRQQRIDFARSLHPDSSETVHQWPDGWSIRRLKTYGDLDREGQLMSNCLAWDHPANEWMQDLAAERVDPQAWTSDISDPEFRKTVVDLNKLALRPLPHSNVHSLRDPSNLPHVSFYAHSDALGDDVLGQHNTDPKPEYWAYLRDWAKQNGIKVPEERSDSFGWEHLDGNDVQTSDPAQQSLPVQASYGDEWVTRDDPSSSDKPLDCPQCNGEGFVGDDECPMCNAEGFRPWLYHVAPTSERERIQAHGLQPSVPVQSGHWPASGDAFRGQPPGVYLDEDPFEVYNAMEHMQDRGLDVWRVNPYVVQPQEDPIWSGSVYHAGAIAPEHLTLARGAEASAWDAHPPRAWQSHVRTGKWADVAEKAKRLLDSGNVTLLRNGYNNVVAHVIGDHGEYTCEIGRDDPNSRAISTWTCECGIPGTRIVMADGTLKNIEDICKGDLVLTATGRVGKVGRTMNRQYDGEIVGLKISGATETVWVTDNHKLLDAEYMPKEAGDWQTGDWSFLPQPYYNDQWEIRVSDYVEGLTEIDGLLYRANKTYGSKRLRKEARTSSVVATTQKAIPARISLDEKFARLLGLFVAEGIATPRGELRWHFHKDEEHLADEIVSLLEAYSLPGAQKKWTRHCWTVAIQSKPLAMLFTKLVGTGSRDKRLCSQIMAMNIVALPTFMAAWVEGDGHEGQNNRNFLNTASDDLAMQARLLLARLGRESIVRKTENNSSSLVPGGKSINAITWRREDKGVRDARVARYFDVDNAQVSQRMVIERKRYTGTVHNFEVLGEHSYVFAPGIASANCPWDQYAWARTRQWKKYEGRPCAHVMAALWQSMGTPLDEQLSEEQAQGMGTGQAIGPGMGSPLPGSGVPAPTGLPQSFDPEGNPMQGDQMSLFTGQPEMGAQPLAPPSPADVLPPFPGAPPPEQIPLIPGSTPGGQPAPPGSISVPGAKPPSPFNPLQWPGGTYSRFDPESKTSAWWFAPDPAGQSLLNQTQCPNCEGKGIDRYGGKCPACLGSGINAKGEGASLDDYPSVGIGPKRLKEETGVDVGPLDFHWGKTSSAIPNPWTSPTYTEAENPWMCEGSGQRPDPSLVSQGQMVCPDCGRPVTIRGGQIPGHYRLAEGVVARTASRPLFQARQSTYSAMTSDPHRDQWNLGETAHFEYHCNRAHESPDAPLWYRSHQPVQILGMAPDSEQEVVDWPVTERMDEGMPLAWNVRFPDGHEGHVMDDELYTGPEHFDPNGGPPPTEEIAQHDPSYAMWLQSRTASAGQFNPGDQVTLSEDAYGLAPSSEVHGDDQYHLIPAGEGGEVLYQDPTTQWLECHFPLQGGELTPHGVRCFLEPSQVKPSRRTPGSTYFPQNRK